MIVEEKFRPMSQDFKSDKIRKSNANYAAISSEICMNKKYFTDRIQ